MASEACAACGHPTESPPVCAACTPLEPLVVSAAERWEWLQGAGPEQRPLLLLSVVRSPRLWHEVGVADLHLALELFKWLVTHRPNLAFSRWLSEDREYGHLAIPHLVREDSYDRVLCRAPVWIAQSPAKTEALAQSLVGLRAEVRALGFRIGSCQDEDGLLDGALEPFQRLETRELKRTIDEGRKVPTRATWIPLPSDLRRAREWVRWPIVGIGPRTIECCDNCGEPRTEDLVCGFCGEYFETTTDIEPYEVFVDRLSCPRCAIDLCTQAVPRCCPGCHLELPRDDADA